MTMDIIIIITIKACFLGALGLVLALVRSVGPVLKSNVDCGVI